MRLTTPLLTLLLAAAPVSADPLVDVIDRGSARVTLDGVLREWSGGLSPVDDRAMVDRPAAWAGADDASFAFAVARDDDALYVAAEVRDDRVVRSAQHRPGEDALVVTLAFPRGRVWTAWEVALQPGEPGSYAGAVQYRGGRARPVPGAQIVEGPSQGGGFTVEARVPWSALPGLRENLAAARVRVAYADADRAGSVDCVIANGGGDVRRPQDLPPTVAASSAVAAAAVDQLARFRAERGVGGQRALLERGADLTGGPAPERVAVFPRHLVAFGPDVNGGGSYTYLEFPTGEVVSAELRDVTGDRKADALVTLRAGAGGFDREILHVYVLDAAGGFQRVFARDVGRAQGAARLANRVTYAGTRVTFAQGENRGFTAATWPAAAEAGVDPPVTPWGPHRAQTYAWSAASRSFALERSEPNPNGVAGATQPAPSGAEPPLEPAQPTPDVEGVLRLFRQRENLPADARPSFRATGDAAEDATPEQFYVFGRTLVLVGPRYQGGAAYSSIGLPANPGDEVVALRAADVTDDGHVEAIVTVRRNVTVQVRGAPIASQRDMLFAYSFDAAHRGRVFGAEVARRVGGDAVVNAVTLPRGRRGAEVTIEAGAARGWTEATYPFHDAPPQGYEPLLLPWGAVRRVTWRWNGSSMARVP